MTEAWFSPDAARYFILVAGLGLTALAVPFIARGTWRRTVVTIWAIIIAAGLGFLAVGAVAGITGQPFHVTAPLLLTGLFMAAGYGLSLVFVLRAYRLAERRKVAAQEL